MEKPIQVTYKVARNSYAANKLISEIRNYDTFSADFEAATKYTPEEREAMEAELEQNPTKRRRIQLESTLAATALDHPAHVALTHCSIAVSDNEAYVFILDNKPITTLVLNFLVTTQQRQVWHNATFDFKHIYYHIGKLPQLFEDTQILAKTILNHVEVFRANTGLKQLAGHKYGNWAISTDNFDLSTIYDDHVHHYAAIDACATFWLWNSIQRHIGEANV